MSVLVNKHSRVIVQGFTGKEGTFHATQMIEYGTQVVGGVTPGKGGHTHLDRPIFNPVHEAVEKAGADVSIIFVPPAFAADAIMEAADAGIGLIVAITEGIPVQDMVRVKPFVQARGSRLIGPNCPGVITPGEAKLGQSTCIGIGGDPIIGTTTLEAVKLLMDDPGTEGIILIGEIGGPMETEAARWIAQHGTKPVVGFIAGRTAPKGRRMGHAGAIIGGVEDTADAKMAIMAECGLHVVETPAVIGETMAAALKVAAG
jgi:succinyl-CoA synthetase alpha subunit